MEFWKEEQGILFNCNKNKIKFYKYKYLYVYIIIIGNRYILYFIILLF